MKILIVFATTALMATSAFAAEQTWAGAVSDKMCGTDHKKMASYKSERDCTLTCAKHGAPYVFVSEGKVYQLRNRDADVQTHAGHRVKLSGELKGDTIRVSKIEMPQP
jgi:hypothetical protein